MNARTERNELSGQPLTEEMIQQAEEVKDTRDDGYCGKRISDIAPGGYFKTSYRQTAKGLAIEVVIDCEHATHIGCTVRWYQDGTRLVSFESYYKISRKEAEARIKDEIASKAEDDRLWAKADAELEAQKARGTSQNLNAMVRDGMASGSNATYEEWDMARRELFKLHEGDAAVEASNVVHGEWESYMTIGNEGRVVAVWYGSTGDCYVLSPAKAAEYMAEAFQNLVRNSLQHGWEV